MQHDSRHTVVVVVVVGVQSRVDALGGHRGKT